MRIILLILSLVIMNTTKAQDFVQVEGTQFKWKSKPYYFIGTNFWYGMNLGSKGESGDQQRLIAELDHLKELGVTNLRIMATSQGPDTAPWRMLPTMMPESDRYNNELLEGLDFLLAEMGKREMHAVLCLNNFWPWSGGMAQYVRWFGSKPIPYPPPAKGGSWWKYMKYASRFYKNPKAQKAFQAHVELLVQRTNSITGVAYKNDPTIMAWQLANEPRGVLRAKAMNRWIDKTARFIKSLDQNHLVSVGSEGNTSSFTAGNDFVKNHSSYYVDYGTIHIWVQNWLWYKPEAAEKSYPKALAKAKKYIEEHIHLAKAINKPLVLEEFGISRDQNSHESNSSTSVRDAYFEAIFQLVFDEAGAGSPLVGCNFWAWAGQGRPRAAETIWQKGDAFIGDPPHEHQGWYSIYDRDKSTLAIIAAFAKKMNTLTTK